MMNGPRPSIVLLALAGMPASPLLAQHHGPLFGWGSTKGFLAPPDPCTGPVAPYMNIDPPCDPNPWVTQADPGYQHCLAVRLDGSLIGWGVNTHGEAGVRPTNFNSAQWRTPPGTTSAGQATAMKFHQVSAGWWHSVGIIRDDSEPPNDDGKVAGWGYNTSGQCDGPQQYRWQVVGAGESFSAGLVSDPGGPLDGKLIAWGAGCFAEGYPCDPTRVADDALRLADQRFVFLSVNGGHHGLCLTAQGKMYGFGYNHWGEAGFYGVYNCDGSLNTNSQCFLGNAALIPPADTVWKTVAAGHYHSIGLTDQDVVLCWGWNGFHQCEVPDDLDDDVAIHGPIVALAAGHDDSSVKFADGTARKWGGGSSCPFPPVCPSTGECIPYLVILASDHWDDLGIGSRLPGNSCYANCDGSTTAPVLNVNDFACFANLYAAGSTWANCDGSSVAPVLNANDFMCMLNLFAEGCP